MEKILVLDFGGQYNQLIARCVREMQVYAEIKPYRKITVAEIREEGYKGIIFTGGPNSVYDEKSPHCDPDILKAGIPILGICYGAQLLSYMGGGEVASAGQSGEFGRVTLQLIRDSRTESKLFRELPKESVCWMSHTDYISRVPEGYRVTAITEHCPCAAMENEAAGLYAVQFHPEVSHTRFGKEMIRRFLFDICGCRGDWIMQEFTRQAIEGYREELAGKKLLLALSGGVDSSVAAVLLHRAVGHNLTCVFVDHGLLRKGEGDMVEKTFREEMNMNLIRVDAKQRFLKRLSGVTDPETKRKIIGEEFIRVFEEEAEKLGHVDILAQGTIYPDIIESGKGDSAVIKSHHNVGGLPDVISFDEIVEPLKYLFKDEVRKVGTELQIPHELVWRQPFPGPGLAVRVIGEVTEEKLEMLRDADAIFREEIAGAGLEKAPDQYFAALMDSFSVGVKGDARAYGYIVALRAVTTDDFMTADWTRLPYEVLERAGSRIANEVNGITRVVYDITSKPPATVEME
ncbi:MAG: glutamine-hydrolyzing GMP synthase [Lachnospiraceae bacterium]|nr:glutamine-hydrolyzing GMP synthase [Lachnospiraceae bacterium]